MEDRSYPHHDDDPRRVCAGEPVSAGESRRRTPNLSRTPPVRLQVAVPWVFPPMRARQVEIESKGHPGIWLVVEGGIRAWETAADFAGGEYRSRPSKGAAASAAHWAAWLFSQDWWRRELYKPDYPTPEALITAWAADSTAQDPNDDIAQARAWQRHDIGQSPGFREISNAPFGHPRAGAHHAFRH